MKNSNYWQDRFKQLEEAQHEWGAKAFGEMEKQYREAQKELEAAIDKWYRRFAENNNISMAEARKWLTGKDLKEFKWSVEEYIAYGEEHAISGRWAKELENASAKYHISRLEALKIQTQQALERLFTLQNKTITDTLSDVFRTGYYRTAFELQKGFEIGFDVGQIDNDYLAKVLAKPWAADGKNFSERIWDNKEKLINELHTELSRNIITGADPQKAIDAIAHKLDVSKSNAGRLVMTEEAYFSSLAQKECFEDLDVEEYEIVATLDNRTSEICQEMDGQHFPMKDFEAGVTAPPFHVNCRSTTCPYFNDEFSMGERAARDENGEVYYVPSDLTYPEWKEAFVDGGSKEGLSSGQVGDSNADSVLELIRDFDYNNEEKIKQEFRAFSDKYIDSKDEHAYVISPNGKLYEIQGGHSTVDITLAGDDALKDAIVIHNHPDTSLGGGDCFSEDDFGNYFKYRIKDLYVVNHINNKKPTMYKMSYKGEPLTEREARSLYKDGLFEVWYENEIYKLDREFEQLETMKVLKRNLKGLYFDEVQ